MGRLVFSAGVLGASLVAAIVSSLALAWGTGEVAGYRRSLECRPFEARWFYGVYTTCVVGAAVFVWCAPDLVWLIIAAQVLNAFLLPLVIGFLVALAVKALPEPIRLRGSYLWLMSGVSATVAALGLFGGVSGLLPSAAPHYFIQKLERGSIVRTVSASGAINPGATAPITARVTGVIQVLSCDVGAKVKARQLCAKIDPRPYQIVADKAKTDLAEPVALAGTAKTNLAKMKAALERLEARAKRRPIPRKVLDEQRKVYERDKARIMQKAATVAERQAALHAAEINLAHTDIVSPVDGIIVSRNARIGRVVAPGSEAPLFVVASDLSLVRVEANVSAKDIGDVKLGDKATLTVEPYVDHPFSGAVTQIGRSPRTVEDATTYDVTISAPNPD
ncbi:MAG: efflux RND transporter periplasmic adaptor subunit, partial [Steroidobacteraceae bacterium]